MNETNYLIGRLRAASSGRDDDVFARLPAGGSVTFGALFSGAEGMASALVSCGVQPGDRVAVQVDKTIEAIEL